MPVSCVAYGCSNRYKSNSLIHFFRFPLNNEVTTKLWTDAIKRKNFIPNQWSRICSVHFTDNDYQIRPDANRPILKVNAVPSVFPSFPVYYQHKPKKLRNPPKNRDLPSFKDEPSTSTDPKISNENADLELIDDHSILPKSVDREVQTSHSSCNELLLKHEIKI
ncbi:THAP domain-containing protein 1-like [Sipha flava]|uniref:THAP domain-containing protein 1-like n=1 Tax=Sipha flava TaxID=143950 RepID=A0A8B8GIR1_9HEMI|nr:THAP domain-containing protein 1-like [Sipha flava]